MFNLIDNFNITCISLNSKYFTPSSNDIVGNDDIHRWHFFSFDMQSRTVKKCGLSLLKHCTLHLGFETKINLLLVAECIEAKDKYHC